MSYFFNYLLLHICYLFVDICNFDFCLLVFVCLFLLFLIGFCYLFFNWFAIICYLFLISDFFICCLVFVICYYLLFGVFHFICYLILYNFYFFHVVWVCGGGWFFSDNHVSPNFLVVLGLMLWLWLWLGCDNFPHVNVWMENPVLLHIAFLTAASPFINKDDRLNRRN